MHPDALRDLPPPPDECGSRAMRDAAFAELSRALISPLPVEEIADLVLFHAKRLTGSRFGYVGYVDPETGFLVSTTMTRDIWDQCQVVGKNSVFKRPKGLWGWVIENKQPLLTNSPADDPRSAGIPAGHIPIRRFLSVPALFDNRLVGQIALANADRDYDEDDLETARRLARIYALAVERKWSDERLKAANDRLEEKVAERTRELAQLNAELRREIAEKERVARHLRESETLYRNMFEKNEAAKLLIDPKDGQIIDANEAAVRFYGYSREALLAKKITSINTAPTDSVLADMNAACRGARETFHFNHRLASGEVRAVEVHASPLERQGRKLLYSTIFDVTERKRAEEAARRAWFELDQIFQTAEGGMRVLDLDFNVVRANETLARITGIPKEQLVGRKCYEAFPGVDCFTSSCNLRSILDGREVRTREVVKRDAKGREIFCRLTAQPFRDANGQIIGAIESFEDVTEKKRLESIAEAVNTMNNIGFVFSGIRHELGNPINSIKMTLSVLKSRLDRFPTETVREYLDRALADVARVEYLLRSLKNFSMYEHLRLEPVALAPFLCNFEALIAEDLQKRSVELDLQLPPEGAFAFADPRALQQVMLNLVTNALDALEGRENPRIRIRAEEEDGLALLFVEDNGRGMTPRQLSDLFKPFYTDKPHGTGLGLVITKKMMAKMSGTIEVRSTEGSGTTILLSLPKEQHGPE